MVQTPWCSRAHLGHTVAEAHLEAPCPDCWNLKQHKGDGAKGSTFTSKYLMWISLGRSVLQKLKNKTNNSICIFSLIIVPAPDTFDCRDSLICQLISYVDVSHAG